MLTEPAAFELTQPYEGLTKAVYLLRINADGAHSLVHPQGIDFAFGRQEIVDLEAAGILKRWFPEGIAKTANAPIGRNAQMVALRAKSPLRPPAGRTASVDGLALFDMVRQPRLL